MSYKCPLCLTELTDGFQLVRTCLDHPNIPAVQITIHDDEEEGLPETVYCPGGDGRCNNAIYPGVFLRHVGCHAHNPFWDATTRSVNIPGADSTTTYRPGDSQATPVTHWEIGMLRSTPAAQEMWFPLMLLRATGETINSQSDQRIGALVELAGSTKVGKTILAMQSMEYEGYIDDENGLKRHVEVKDFMFSRLPPGWRAEANPLLGNLYLSSLLRLNKKGLYRFPGTFKMPGDVKAAFIAPAQTDRTSLSLNSSGNESQHIKTKIVVKNIVDFFKGIGEIFWSPRPPGFWYTVAFYDIAGEAFKAGDPTTDAIERAVDKVAVLVDATDIFHLETDSDGDSVPIANQQIGQASARGLPHCLIVTKIDLVIDKLSSEERAQVKKYAEDLSRDYENESRELFRGWLNQRTSDPNIRQLKNRIDAVDRIFFIWTDNLPTASTEGTVQTSSLQPQSYGLARFICWCLDIPWTAINKI